MSTSENNESEQNYKLPSDTTMQHASKLAIVDDKPIMLDYWSCSLDKKGLIGNIFSTIQSNKTLNITNLNTVRNYMHVDDFCKFIYKSIVLKQKKIIINLGSENISINEIIRIIEKKTKFKIKCNNFKLNKIIDPNIRLNTNKMLKLFKYKPKIKLKNTLEAYIKTNEI